MKSVLVGKFVAPNAYIKRKKERKEGQKKKNNEISTVKENKN